MLSFCILVENSSKIGLANKDRKNRPMQQEDEYRIQMELNRYYLRKDSLSAGVSSEQSFYETEAARTPSSRGKQLKKLTSESYILIIEQGKLNFGCCKMEFSNEKTEDPRRFKFISRSKHSLTVVRWHACCSVPFDCIVLFCKS